MSCKPGRRASRAACGRDCYPPANLWYRVAVEFDGQLTFHAQKGLRGLRACFPCWVRTTELKWRIAGHNAVRIRLRLHFSPRAASFGRRYAAILEATQEEITESPINPVPPPGTPLLQDEQSYHYKIVLEPCPNRGLDVERC